MCVCVRVCVCVGMQLVWRNSVPYHLLPRPPPLPVDPLPTVSRYLRDTRRQPRHSTQTASSHESLHTTECMGLHPHMSHVLRDTPLEFYQCSLLSAVHEGVNHMLKIEGISRGGLLIW